MGATLLFFNYYFDIQKKCIIDKWFRKFSWFTEATCRSKELKIIVNLKYNNRKRLKCAKLMMWNSFLFLFLFNVKGGSVPVRVLLHLKRNRRKYYFSVSYETLFRFFIISFPMTQSSHTGCSNIILNLEFQQKKIRSTTDYKILSVPGNK